MKKKAILFMVLIFMSTYIFAEAEISEFMNAKLFAEEENYLMSYELLKKISEKSDEINLFLGEICEKTGKYEEAMSCYKELAAKDKNNYKARFSIVKLHIDSPLKDLRLAEKELNEIYTESKDKKIKKAAKKLLEATKNIKKSEKKYDIEVSFETLYKNNINDGTSEEKIFKDKYVSVKKKEDTVFDFSFMTEYKWYNKKSLSIHPYLDSSYQMYQKNNEYSNLNFGIGLRNEIKKEKSKIAFPISVGIKFSDRKWEESSFNSALSSEMIFEKLILTPHIALSTTSNYKSETDSMLTVIGLGGKNGLRGGQIMYDISYSADSNSDKKLSNSKLAFLIGYAKEVKKNIEAGLNYKYENKSYMEKVGEPFYKERKEGKNTISCDAVFRNNIADINTGIEYNINSSTIDLYDYNGFSAKLGINKRF